MFKKDQKAVKEALEALDSSAAMDVKVREAGCVWGGEECK